MANKGTYEKVITCAARVSFPHLAEPQLGPGGTGVPKYALKLLIPKDPKQIPEKIRNLENSKSVEEIKELSKKLAFEYWDGVVPKGYKKLVKDGDDDSDYPEDKGMYIISARSTKKPGCVDGNCREMTEKAEIEERIKAGYWVRCSLAIGCTETGGSKCCHAILQNVQLLAKDKTFGSRVSAKDEFAGIPGFVDEDASEVERDFSANEF